MLQCLPALSPAVLPAADVRNAGTTSRMWYLWSPSPFFFFSFPLLIYRKKKIVFYPATGCFLLLLEEGETFAPHISFSLAREKETCRARYKEKERWERLSWRKLLLFRSYSTSWKQVPWCYADWFYHLRRWRWAILMSLFGKICIISIIWQSNNVVYAGFVN